MCHEKSNGFVRSAVDQHRAFVAAMIYRRQVVSSLLNENSEDRQGTAFFVSKLVLKVG